MEKLTIIGQRLLADTMSCAAPFSLHRQIRHDRHRSGFSVPAGEGYQMNPTVAFRGHSYAEKPQFIQTIHG
jgi:hypothetical protein